MISLLKFLGAKFWLLIKHFFSWTLVRMIVGLQILVYAFLVALILGFIYMVVGAMGVGTGNFISLMTSGKIPNEYFSLGYFVFSYVCILFVFVFAYFRVAQIAHVFVMYTQKFSIKQVVREFFQLKVFKLYITTTLLLIVIMLLAFLIIIGLWYIVFGIGFGEITGEFLQKMSSDMLFVYGIFGFLSGIFLLYVFYRCIFSFFFINEEGGNTLVTRYKKALTITSKFSYFFVFFIITMLSLYVWQIFVSIEKISTKEMQTIEKYVYLASGKGKNDINVTEREKYRFLYYKQQNVAELLQTRTDLENFLYILSFLRYLFIFGLYQYFLAVFFVYLTNNSK